VFKLPQTDAGSIAITTDANPFQARIGKKASFRQGGHATVQPIEAK
jgi:hypothetical protein